MAEAKITVTMSPQEFDLLRRVMSYKSAELKEKMKLRGATPKERQEYREFIAEIDLFLKKL